MFDEDLIASIVCFEASDPLKESLIISGSTIKCYIAGNGLFLHGLSAGSMDIAYI